VLLLLLLLLLLFLLLGNGFGGTPIEYEEIFISSICLTKIFDSACTRLIEKKNH
jgi:hypothetical protein